MICALWLDGKVHNYMKVFQISLTSIKILNIMMCYLSFAGLMNKMTGKKATCEERVYFILRTSWRKIKSEIGDIN